MGEGEKGKAAAKEFWEALGSLAEGFSGLTASADEVYGGMFKLAQKCVCGRECA